MKQAWLAILTMVAMSLLVLSCGGGSMGRPSSLPLQLASASAFADFETGFYQGVPLTATLSNGAVPTGAQWKTSAGCVAIDPQRTQNTNTVICNFTCGPGTATANDHRDRARSYWNVLNHLHLAIKQSSHPVGIMSLTNP